jgi:hypothetical protein
MTVSTNLTCPECGAVLRSNKPVSAGKSVKCPKCGAGFVVGGDGAAHGVRTAAAPVQKKPAAAAPVAPLRPDDDDDEGGGGMYTFRNEEQTSAAPAVDYQSELESRDLRGPAMKEIVDPSNKLILVGTSGFLGWVALAIAMSIPVLFPIETKEERDKARAAKMLQLQMLRNAAGPMAKDLPPIVNEEDSSIFTVGVIDLRAVGNFRWYLIVLCFLPTVLGMAYSAVLSMGAVKIQNLEGREWGIAASVMAMVPLNAGGLLFVLALVLNLVLDLMFEGWFKYMVLGFLLICAWGTNLAAGIWMLTILNKPEVIAGYEYVAD